MTKNEIYQYLIKNLTADNLKEVSMKIIDAYKEKNIEFLQSYAEHLNIDYHDFEDSGNRLFLKLIKHFHPDMLGGIQNEIELSYNKDQLDRLQFYKNLLSADKKVKTPGRSRYRETPGGSAFKYARKEEYHFDEHDFGYSVSGDNKDPGDSFINEVEEELDFIKALKAAYIGNNDLHLSPADLESFKEELVLCDYGISDLNGLQHCINVTSLNLSNNNISNVYEIKYLSELKEIFISSNRVSDIDYLKNLSSLEIIDLSDNEISDISVLSQFESLKFADVRNNPLSPGAVEALLNKKDMKKDLYVAY